ncbi:MAG: glucokinase, partial [Methylocella sp.]
MLPTDKTLNQDLVRSRRDHSTLYVSLELSRSSWLVTSLSPNSEPKRSCLGRASCGFTGRGAWRLARKRWNPAKSHCSKERTRTGGEEAATLRLCWALTARFAGDLALAFLAKGGVTFSGGILPRIVEFC